MFKIVISHIKWMISELCHLIIFINHLNNVINHIFELVVKFICQNNTVLPFLTFN